jgi:hypothetical protein
MRTHMLARWPLVAGLALVVGACSESLTSVNQNPNSPPDIGPEFLFPQAVRSAVENTYSRMLLAHTSIWAQQTVQVQYPDEERGRVRSETMQAFWDSYYAGSLWDIQTVIAKAQAAGEPNMEAVALIWKTWIFHQITDLWGDVPYSQALRLGEGITAPAYDTQQAIYTGMIQTLKTAEALLDPAEGGFGAGDILYGDDFESWRRFSVSLRMRLAMRLSEALPVIAQTEFADAYADGGFQSNADNAMLAWPGPPYQNPSFENRVLGGRDDDGISDMMVRTLMRIDTATGLVDPRLQLYAEPADSPATPKTYLGLGNNIRTPPLSLVWYSRIGNFWRFDGASTPTAIMTYSEVLFLEAEAAQRGWILTPGDAATLYVAAIRANMTQYTAVNTPTAAEIDAYVADTAVVYKGGAVGFDQIQLQKWISLYMQGSEAWANQRRTDRPSLTLGPNITGRPVRFPYPPGEQSLNSASLTVAVNRQMPQGDPRTIFGRVWWDVVTPP